MRRSGRRLVTLLVVTPLLLLSLAAGYMLGMEHLEHRPRDFLSSVQWASDTLTTTGYGQDSHWEHPAMVVFVVLTQFGGIALTFVVFSLIIVPYFEERFEGRLSRRAPRRGGYVLIYRFGPAVSALLDAMRTQGVFTVVLEEEEAVARRLVERGEEVVFTHIEDEDPDPSVFTKARSVVANGSDQENAALILAARQLGYQGDIVALVDEPLHRKPMMLAGATAVYTPLHILAAAMAALASERISPRVRGARSVGGDLQTAELRIGRDSPLAGKTLAQANLRAQTGATIVGQWVGGDFQPHPQPSQPLQPGAILVAMGSADAIEKLGDLATPISREAPIVVCGQGAVGAKVVQLLRDAGESVVVLDRRGVDGVDVHGDVLEQAALEQAGVREARGVVLTLGDDNTTLFSASVVRDYAPDVPIIARVNRADYVTRVQQAGCDFALSLSEVAAELLAQKILGGEWSSPGAGVKVEKVGPTGLVGQTPAGAKIGELTGVSLVAVERDGEVVLDLADFRIGSEDVVYICGPEAAITRFHQRFPGS